jgi:hypothetical protein
MTRWRRRAVRRLSKELSSRTGEGRLTGQPQVVGLRRRHDRCMTDGPRPRKSERQPECGEDQRTEATMNGEGGEEEEEEEVMMTGWRSGRE